MLSISDKKILQSFCERLLDCGAISEWFYNGCYHVRIDDRQYYLILCGSSIQFLSERGVKK